MTFSLDGILIVLGGFALQTLLAGRWAGRIEGKLETVKQRLDDHLKAHEGD